MLTLKGVTQIRMVLYLILKSRFNFFESFEIIKTFNKEASFVLTNIKDFSNDLLNTYAIYNCFFTV